MEILGWILLWILLVPGALAFIAILGKRAVSRQLSEQPEADPWAEYKRLAQESRERKAKDFSAWDAEYKAVIRLTCTHDFQDEAWREQWWICTLCGHETPWEYQEGCSCITQESGTITDTRPRKSLYHRSGNCMIHGMPRLIAYHKKNKARERGETYADLPSTKYKR